MAFEKLYKQILECMSRIPVIQLTRVEDTLSDSLHINHFCDDSASENDWSRRYPVRDRKSLFSTIAHHEFRDDKGPVDSDGNDSSHSEFQIKSDCSCKHSNEESIYGRPVDIKIERKDDSQLEEDERVYLQEDFYPEDATQISREKRARRRRKIKTRWRLKPRQRSNGVTCRLSGCRFRAKDHDELAQHRTAIHGRSDVRNYKFRCDKCYFKATKPESLELHQRTHTQGRRIRLKSLDSKSLPMPSGKSRQKSEVKILCRLTGCRFLAVDQAQLAQHRSHVHGRTDPARSYDFKCDQCDFRSTKSKSLDIHQRKHTHLEPKRLRRDSKSLNPGKRRRKLDARILCRLPGCRFRAVGVQELLKHRLDVHGRTDPARSYDFKCDQCRFKARSAASLEFHKKMHEVGNVEILETADGTSKWLFKIPTRSYRKPEVKITCRLDGCRFRANDRNHLADHRKNIHGTAFNPGRVYQFRCTEPFCTFRARHVDSYEFHLRTHKLDGTDASAGETLESKT